MPEKDLDPKRRINISPNGQARMSLPRVIANALGSGDVGLILAIGDLSLPETTPY